MQVNRAGAEKTEAGNRNRGKGTEEGAWRHRQEARNGKEAKKQGRGRENRCGRQEQGQEAKKCGQEALSIEQFCVFSPIWTVRYSKSLQV
jgi:hypothetical protein